MSLSINTNVGSMIALESLNATANALTKTQNRVSTGLKVATAADGPASYAIAQKLNGNISGLSAVTDGLAYAGQVMSTTAKAADSIISTLTLIQNAVTSIGNTGIDAATVQAEVDTYINQINTFARNATANGVNLLTSSADASAANGATTLSSMQFVTSLQGATMSVSNLGGTSTVLSNTLGLTSGLAAGSGAVAASDLFGSALTGTPAQSSLQSYIAKVQSAINTMTGFAATFAAATQTIDGMTSYSSNLSDSLTASVGALTDADMAAESAKLTSLQTKQSLAIQSLSIANSSSQNILSLFR